MFIEQVPDFFRNLYPKAFWRMDPNVKAVYLTFDDGPIPVITPWVTDLLERYGIKATFFIVAFLIFKIKFLIFSLRCQKTQLVFVLLLKTDLFLMSQLPSKE